MLRVALVTGGGSGIGRASALALAEAGWSVAIAGRRADALAETVAQAKGGQTVEAFVADIAVPAAVTGLFAAVFARFGRLDLLFNNAGAAAPATAIEELDVAVWRRVIDVNLTGSFLCAQAAVRQFKSQDPVGGRIINNGSISAHAPRPLSAAYTASKHAVTGLTRSLALDGREFSITCGQIDIGNADTPLSRPTNANGRAPEPMMDVAHAAPAVVFMAGLPPDTTVQFMTVMAARMKYIGRG